MTKEMPEEYLIQDALIVDGTGRPPRHGDIWVQNGRIHLDGPGPAHGDHIIGADGWAVAPGFIDTHSHADLEPLLSDPLVHESRITQGVTTEVTGNCGFSPFPIPPEAEAAASQFLALVFGSSAATFPDLDAYSRRMTKAGLASNIAPLVGHGTLRAAALGYDNRPPSREELATMSRALAGALDAGAFGLSTGLCYTPATYASPAEVAALGAVVAAAGGIYSTHIRNETDQTAASLSEAVDVSRATGVPVHVSHLKVAGRRNWGTASEVLKLLERARSSGIDVTADVYPYTAASTTLHSLLPPWTAEEGIEALSANFRNPSWRQRVARDLERGVPGWQNLGTAAGWDHVTLAASPARPELEGHSIAGLAQPGDSGPVDAIARILDENRGKVVVVIEAMGDDDVTAFLTWEHSVVGSDGIPLPGRPHPRLTGTFPRVLGRYREALGSLEAAVHRMTGASAARFGIPGRGVIADGYVADLVIFDPEAVIDRGTYADPWLRPVGIRDVLVAGKPAVLETEVVDGGAGVVLRRG